MKTVDYKLIQSNNKDEVTKEVMDLLKKGYEINGPTFLVGELLITQAMVLNREETEEEEIDRAFKRGPRRT